MATERLTLFDVIVDLIPGVIFLLILSTVVPIGLFDSDSNVLGGAIILLALGYTIGRLIHTIASRKVVERKLARCAWNEIYGERKNSSWGSQQLSEVAETINEETAKNQPITFDFEKRINCVANQYESENLFSIEVSCDKSIPVEHELLRDAVRKLRTKIQSNGPVIEDKKRDLQWETNLKAMEHYAHSILHGQSSLYHRYTILCTFYRNLAVALLLGTILALALAIISFATGHEPTMMSVNDVIFPQASWPVYLFLGIFGVYTLNVILCRISVRWLEFRHRRLRALFNDLHIYLEQ